MRVGIDDSLGNSIEYELDVMGNRVQESAFDPQETLRKTLQRTYDGNNRLQMDLGAGSQMIQYSYDNNGNLLTVADPLFRVTTNQYDVLDRLTRTYDDAGNGATRTDARGITTTYTYDALDRVSAATVTDGTVSYEYDNLTTGGSYAKGRLTKVTDPSGNTTYVYDSLGRVTSKTQSVTASPSAKSFTVSYSYSSGRRTGLTYPSGRVVASGFDAQGQVTSITVDGATTVLSAAEYFPFGAARKWSWGNAQVYERTFDLDGRIKTLSLGPATATYADLRSARAGPR